MKQTTGKKIDTFLTFTKKLIILVLGISIVWVTWSYILATISLIRDHNSNTISEVSTEVVRVLIAAILGYLCKAYFETKQEEIIRLKEKKMDSIIERRQANITQDEPNPFSRNFSDLEG